MYRRKQHSSVLPQLWLGSIVSSLPTSQFGDWGCPAGAEGISSTQSIPLLQFTGWAWHPSQFQIHWEYRLGRGTKYSEKRWSPICEAGKRAGLSHQEGSSSVFYLVCAKSFATAQLMGSNWGCSNLIAFDHVLISHLILNAITSGLTFSFGRWF